MTKLQPIVARRVRSSEGCVLGWVCAIALVIASTGHVLLVWSTANASMREVRDDDQDTFGEGLRHDVRSDR